MSDYTCLTPGVLSKNNTTPKKAKTGKLTLNGHFTKYNSKKCHASPTFSFDKTKK
jgi:hypothetical protein